MAKITYATPQSGVSLPWVGDELNRDHVLPGGVVLQEAAFEPVGNVDATLTAAAAIGATSLSVSALSGAIPAGTNLYFGEAGEFARLTADAAEGATSLTVEALVNALELGDTATYTGMNGRRYAESGSLLGRTYAERDAGTAFGPYAAGDDEVYLLLYDVYDVTENPEATVYRHGSLVYEDKLPAGVDMAAVRDRYQTLAS